MYMATLRWIMDKNLDLLVERRLEFLGGLYERCFPRRRDSQRVLIHFLSGTHILPLTNRPL